MKHSLYIFTLFTLFIAVNCVQDILIDRWIQILGNAKNVEYDEGLESQMEEMFKNEKCVPGDPRYFFFVAMGDTSGNAKETVMSQIDIIKKNGLGTSQKVADDVTAKIGEKNNRLGCVLLRKYEIGGNLEQQPKSQCGINPDIRLVQSFLQREDVFSVLLTITAYAKQGNYKSVENPEPLMCIASGGSNSGLASGIILIAISLFFL